MKQTTTTTTRHCEEPQATRQSRAMTGWIASGKALAMTMMAGVLLFASGCAKDGLSDGDTGRPLTIRVAAPPAWNASETRAAAGPIDLGALAADAVMANEESGMNDEESVADGDARSSLFTLHSSPGADGSSPGEADGSSPVEADSSSPVEAGSSPGGGAATRSVVDPTTGKVSWEEGDVLHLMVRFRSEASGQGGNVVATRYPKLIYTDGEWTFDEPLYWPLTAKSVEVFATYIGTAPADGTKFIDQPVYSAVARANFGTTPEIGSGDTGSWQILCTAIGFTGLRPGQRLWLSGEGWAAISMFNGMISFNSISEPFPLMAGADGTATAYSMISNGDSACNIAVGAEAPVDVAGWSDIRAQLGTTGWEMSALGKWYTFDVSVLAGTGSGSVDPDDYMLSAEARRLVDWAAAYNAGTLSGDELNFTLREDVDLCEYPWTPVGKSWNDNPFIHTFDGGGHTIRGLRVNKTTPYAGLFGYVNTGGAVRSVHVEGTVSGTRDVGGIAGYNNRGTIGGPNEGDKCTFTGTVSGTGFAVGGIVGTNYNVGSITGCAFDGTVTGSSWFVGGIAGQNESGTVTGCTATGVVSGTSWVGGIVGDNGDDTDGGGPITGCTFTGTVGGTGWVGGIAGGNGHPISGCIFSGKVSITDNYAGGIVGGNRGTKANITGCTVIGAGTTVSGTSNSVGNSVGGIVGYNRGGTIGGPGTDACTFIGSVSGSEKVGGIVGYNESSAVISCTTGPGTTVSGSANVGGIVGLNSDASAVIISCSTGDNTAVRNTGFAGYNTGGIVGYNEGGSVAGSTFSGTVNSTVNGASDNTGGIAGINSGTIGGPGTDACTFTGTVIGTNFVGGIVGNNSGGIAGCTTGARAEVEGTGYIGGIAGSNSGLVAVCMTGEGAKVTGTADNSNRIGGIVGENGGGNVVDCTTGARAKVSAEGTGADNVGGIVGRNESTNRAATVTNCHTGEGSSVTSGGTSTGGIVGLNKQGTAAAAVTACSTTGTGMTVTGEGDSTGGIAGNNNGGTIGGPAEGDECTFTGSVKGEGANTGGIVGVNSNGGSITNCSATATGTGIKGTGIYTGGIVGLNSNGGTIGGANADNKCTFTGSVTGTTYTGGIAGANTTGGSITNCSATATGTGIKGTGENTGGIVGTNGLISSDVAVIGGPVSGCVFSGTVSGTNYTGGIAGCIYNGSVTGCEVGANVSISGNDYVGGIVGNITGTSSVSDCHTGADTEISGTGNRVGGIAGNNNNTSSVSLCYSLAEKVTGTGDYIGGIAGNNRGSASQCFWLYADGMTVPNVAVGNGTATGCESSDTEQGVIELWTDAVNAQP